ncbi:hypothetical protein [Streptomyces malaysiensis]|uniref:Uncharacterized protein n=1 Tax=Streptomyces malaysiensis subsp. samsunensis TaxID=459658 RepID=A0A9X2LUD2_STRMQ|nr:hypothetical protein [Streptomyces samsunensis]MCQ8829747.1 hypothetical protein [Streptomyces samsunensis]
MEQSTGPIIPPIHTAGTDPGYVPGLTSPRPADVEEDTPDKAAERPPEKVTAEDEPDEDEGVDAEAESDADADGDVDGGADTTSDVASDEDRENGADEDRENGADEDGGAVFEVSDRRGVIRAERGGVTFELDGEKAEFGWDEIGAVEVDTPRFGKRFGITVYTTNRRWYTADVEAPARRLLKEWTAELDVVLDAYFEDSADSEDSKEPEESKSSEDSMGSEDSKDSAASEPAERAEKRDN